MYKLSELKNGLFAICNCKDSFVTTHSDAVVETIEFTTRFKLIDKDDPDKKQFIHIREASDDPEKLLMQVRAFLNRDDKNRLVAWWAVYEVDSDNKMIDSGMWSDSEI